MFCPSENYKSADSIPSIPQYKYCGLQQMHHNSSNWMANLPFEVRDYTVQKYILKIY